MFWQSYAYQYGVGGLIFLLSIGLALFRGDARWDRPEDHRTVILLLVGIASYALVQGYFQFVLAGSGS